MAKTVTLPPVRVEPEMLAEVQRVSGEMNVSVYELTRMAVAAYVRMFGRNEQAATMAEGEASLPA